MESVQYEGDVLLFNTVDGGEINVVDGQPEMTGGFETAVYLSLFGGNEDDDGRPNNPKTWWPNVEEEDPSKRYVSETQNLLLGLPLTSGNLLKVEEAVKRDLQWMKNENIISKLEVFASIPDVDKINISITIEAEGKEENFNFTINWKAMKNGS